MNKIIENKIYKLNNVDEKEILDKIMKLIVNNNVVFGIDNQGTAYYKNNNKLVKEDIVINKYYMSPSSSYTIPKFFNTQFKQKSLKQLIASYTMEYEVMKDYTYHFDLVLYPFIIDSYKKKIYIYPIIKIYDYDTVLISYNINIPDDFNKEFFIETFADLNRVLFDRILLPSNYGLNLGKQRYIMIDGEKIGYSRHDEKDEYFGEIRSLSMYFLNLFDSMSEERDFYGRCIYLLNKSPKIDDEFIDTLLKGIKVSYKSKLINYSLNNNFERYYNERVSIIVGNNPMLLEAEIEVVDEYMMLETIIETSHVYGIYENKYSYKELKELYNEILFKDSTVNNAFYYIELENYLNILRKQMNRNNRVEYLKSCLDEKMREKEYQFQEMLSIFALIIGAEPISKYCIQPLLHSLKESRHFEMLCYILTCCLIYLIYRITKKIRKK